MNTQDSILLIIDFSSIAIEDRVLAAVNILIDNDCKDNNFMSLLSLFIDSKNQYSLNQLRIYLSKCSHILNPEKRFYLIRDMLNDDVIDIHTVVHILSSFSHKERRQLDKKIINVIETADFVLHEKEEGFLNPNDDNFLRNILNSL